MKPRIPDDVRKEMNRRIKNKLDISSLIEKYSIKGEDLSNAIIEEFNRNGEDISGLNLTNAVIGKESGATHISRANAKNCCFKNTRFLGKVMAKKTNFTNTNFAGAFIPICDYRFANLTNCVFCGTAFTIGTHYSYGSKFDEQLFRDLGKMWNLKVEKMPPKEES